MMVPFVNGWTSAGRKLGHRRAGGFPGGGAEGPDDPEVFENVGAQTLGITCMFMWIILAALAFGAVFDGLGAVKAIENLFTEPARSRALDDPDPDAAQLHADGHVSRRHGHAGDRRAALCAAGRALGFDLVWYGVLYTITCQIAYMTPPFGYNLFLMRAMAPPEIICATYLSLRSFPSSR
jgi:hypothetical protein